MALSMNIAWSRNQDEIVGTHSYQRQLDAGMQTRENELELEAFLERPI